jgi:hypothetical protein
MTEALAQLEGLERGPAGNTSLAAGFVLAQEADADQIVVVQETEYTGAGKHPTAQLTFARELGVEIRRAHPGQDVPGTVIAIPRSPEEIGVENWDLDDVRRSFLRRTAGDAPLTSLAEEDVDFLASEVKAPVDTVRRWLDDADRAKARA